MPFAKWIVYTLLYCQREMKDVPFNRVRVALFCKGIFLITLNRIKGTYTRAAREKEAN